VDRVLRWLRSSTLVVVSVSQSEKFCCTTAVLCLCNHGIWRHQGVRCHGDTRACTGITDSACTSGWLQSGLVYPDATTRVPGATANNWACVRLSDIPSMWYIWMYIYHSVVAMVSGYAVPRRARRWGTVSSSSIAYESGLLAPTYT
jgi:hypothetical protein